MEQFVINKGPINFMTIGDYTLLKELGSGGEGTVYLAFN